MPESLSATIGAAYDKAVSSSPAAEPAPSAPSRTGSNAPTPSTAEPTGSPRSTEVQGQPEADATTATPGQRVRDPSGRFTKADGTAQPPATEGAEEGQPATQLPAPAAQPLKPPGRLKPEAKAVWDQAPPVLQAEVKRMEVEHRKEIETSAQARRLADEFNATIQPYAPLFTRPPLEEVKGLLETARVLRVAPPAQKAAMVAQILRTFQVDPGLVADAFEGRQAAEPQEFRDPRVDQILAQRQQALVRKQQEVRAKAQEELAEFQATEPEFYEEVRPTMAALMAAAHEQGQRPTLAEVYEAACLANATVRPLYQKRQSAIAAATAPQALSHGKASASLRHEPSIPAPSKPGSLKDDIAATYDALIRRR